LTKQASDARTGLALFGSQPLSPVLPADEAVRSAPVMQVAVEVTDEIRREAEARGLPIIDYVEMLVARGQKSLEDESAVAGAIERIRALRASAGPGQ
jgi:hypothetical protein